MSQVEQQQTVTTQPAVESKTKSVKVKKAVKTTTTKTSSTENKHPKFIEMIIDGLKKLNERSGSSRHALLNYITSTYALDSKLANQHLKLALKNGVKNGLLKQLKGIGSNGSFKIGEEAKKKVAKTKTNPGVKKTVTTTKPKVTKKDGEEKPKKNIKKIVKLKTPKPINEKPTVAKKDTKPKTAEPKIKKAISKTEAKAKVQLKSPVVKKAVPKKLTEKKKPTTEKKTTKKSVKA